MQNTSSLNDRQNDNSSNYDITQQALPKLNKTEEYALLEIVQSNPPESPEYQKALTKLIRCNIRLIAKITKEYGYYPHTNFYEDAINYGVIGLIEATSIFDMNKGCRFITFCHYYIRIYIKKTNNYKFSESRPVNWLSKQQEYIKLIRKLSQELNRNPTYNDLHHLGNLSWIEAQEAFVLSNSNLSLDYKVYDPKSLELEKSNIYKDKLIKDFSLDLKYEEDKLEDIIVEERLTKIKEIEYETPKLSDKERFIIKHYYGFVGDRPKTYEEIGNLLGNTRESIRQNIDKAKRKLSHIPELRELVG